jgi:hypothetical protein
MKNHFCAFFQGSLYNLHGIPREERLRKRMDNGCEPGGRGYGVGAHSKAYSFWNLIFDPTHENG